jgi:hypothetical protein
VRVAQHDGVDLPGVKGKTAVALDGFVAVALEQAAFEQQPPAVHFQQIHGTGGGARGAEKMDFHAPQGKRLAS